jgi:hypothetical protein
MEYLDEIINRIEDEEKSSVQLTIFDEINDRELRLKLKKNEKRFPIDRVYGNSGKNTKVVD